MKTLNKKQLLLTSLLSSVVMASATPSYAQSSDDNVDEIIVTGSRIKRDSTFAEGAQVVEMGEAYIDNVGTMVAADVLRQSPLNTFGSFSERSGSSAQSNATINLRGLGSDRSLVLINGGRIPGSPNLSASSMNINMLPMAALERIEVLADGASAVYGSDAIAGVVNMIMKENFEGLQANARYGMRSNDDGEEKGVSVLAGASNDRGNVTVAVEWNKRDPIFDKDREYTAPYAIDSNGDGIVDIYNETDGYSYYGRTWNLYDDSTGYDQILAAAECPTTDGFYGVMGAAAFGYDAGTVCAYGYGLVSANKASLDRFNSYISANYDLTDNLEMYGRALFSQVKSFGRYAPPAAPWINPPIDYSHNPFDIQALLDDGSISEDYTLIGFYRWTNIGTRDNEVTDVQTDVTLGGRGEFSDSLSYDFYVQSGDYTSKEFGYYYLSYPGLDSVLASGIDPFSAAGAGAMRATPTQDNFTRQKKIYGHIQKDFGDLYGSGNVSVLVGAEHYRLKYQNKYDAHSEAGLIGGSAGNSSEGGRDVTAVFGEALLPLFNTAEVQLAGRYDDYSDFGSNFAPSVSATWRPMDSLFLRGRWGQAFRAPDLSSLGGITSFSASSATDPQTGTTRQFDTWIFANSDLGPEKSNSFSFGGKWEARDWFNLDVTYWNTHIKDIIGTPSTQSLLYADASGYNWDANCLATDQSVPGVCVQRGASGNVRLVKTIASNNGELKTNGLDFQANGFFDTDYGTFGYSGLWTHILKYEVQPYYEASLQDVIGYNQRPKNRWQAVGTYDYGLAHLSLVANYTGVHSEEDDVAADGSLTTSDEDLDSWLTWDASARFDIDRLNSNFKIGINNLTNEDPVLDKDGLFTMPSLYNNTGRVIYLEYGLDF